jgi:hypothetical protein
VSSLLDLHLQYTTGSECTVQNHRWAMIACVSALLGRRVSLPFGHLTVYPNMYVFLVGLPSTRKSMAIGVAERLLRQSGYDYFAFSRSSREKFLLDFEEGFGNRDESGELDMIKMLDEPFKKGDSYVSECFICIDEFIDFIKQKNSDFLTLLTTMYDNKDIPYRERLKNSKSVSIPKPTINVLAGLTPTSLSMVMPAEMIGQGYTSRLILVHSGKVAKRITFPSPPDPVLGDAIVEKLQRLQTFSGVMKYSPEAEVLLDQIYQGYVPLVDSRLQHYCSRRFIHLLKLCMIFASMRESLTITSEIVEEANTNLSYAEAYMHLALGEFGDAKYAKATQAIMEVLSQSEFPLTMMEIWASVSTYIDKISILNDILNNLAHTKKIILNNETDTTLILLNRELKSKNTIGINYERWIQEYDSLPD